MRTPIALSLALCLSLFPSLASAEEITPEGGGASKPVYVDLTSALAGSYGSGPHLQYCKADTTLQMVDKDAATKIEYHELLIRSRLIMLSVQQIDQSLDTVEAKRSLRQEALKQVQQTLEQEEGKSLVADLLFNNFIVQPWGQLSALSRAPGHETSGILLSCEIRPGVSDVHQHPRTDLEGQSSQ